MRRLAALSSPNESDPVQSFSSAVTNVEQLYQTLVKSHDAVKVERQAFAELPQQQANLAARENALQTRLQQILEREASLAERDLEFSTRTARFEARQTSQTNDAAELAVIRKNLSSHTAALDARDFCLSSREDAVAAREKSVAARTAAQDRRQQLLDELDDELAISKDRIAKSKEALDNLDARKAQAERNELRLIQTDNELKARKEQLDDQEKRLEIAKEGLKRRETSVNASLDARDEVLGRQLDDINTKLDELQENLKAPELEHKVHEHAAVGSDSQSVTHNDDESDGTKKPGLPRYRQPLQSDYTAWGRFCDNVHNFLYHNCMVLDPVAAQTSDLTIDEAGMKLVRLARDATAHSHLRRLSNEAVEGEWFCFKRMVKRGSMPRAP
ncbi:hypothetical protein PG996_013710 [Apiospora saccharicola]|uniref:Uncharacterized protein n=1 Tax=Apiospora saccharicola TaxID=335842 RepID=A0ABR1U8Z1_9PEZI